jgi:hypothetical protein
LNIDLMQIFARPRPSGSSGEQRTLQALLAWLQAHAIPSTIQRFRLFPYSNELIGLWLLASVIALTATIGLRLPWLWLVGVGIAILLVIANVVTGLPLVTWLIPGVGENVILTFDPPGTIEREVVVSTHYDSKTELFDHTITGNLFGKLPAAIGLAALALVLGAIDQLLLSAQSDLSLGLRVVGLLICLRVARVVGLVGLNLIPGRWIAPSQGAIDNGAACVITLRLAERLAAKTISHPGTRVTLALFAGEEVSMQGSRAWLRSRPWPYPISVINLELLGQNGPYVIWQNEGNVLTSAPTDTALNQRVAATILATTGNAAQLVGGINSDGYTFVKAGIPTCVLGSYDHEQGGSGLHRPSDNLARVQPERLDETVAILAAFLAQAR